MSEYEDAVTALYQAPLSEFVAERKRLAAELKATGDKEAAVRFGKLLRPPVSAWVVNQLWWREADAFSQLLSAAARVKVGDREASLAHRQALARLRDAAAQLLRDSGNAATDATLRRVTTTLSAVAASGGFAPDAPGALSADRDPPGFEALGFGAAGERETAAPTSTTTPTAEPAEDDAPRRAAEAEKRRAQEAERRRVEETERQRRLAEREHLSGLLREAAQLRDARQRELSRLRAEVEAADQSLKESQALVSELEQRLASL